MSASALARGKSRPRAELVRELPAPPIRLRVVLLLGLAAWLVSAGYPRLQAAFRLHDVAVAVADYGLCMVGPTGPALLRDRSPEFELLVRRRLLASAPGEQPFARCAKTARSILQSTDAGRAHERRAADFPEYREPSARGVAGLDVSAATLGELYERAWPFVRGGYTRLVKPSLGAVEAAHLPAPARPGFGRGLPARPALYRSIWKRDRAWFVALGSGDALSVHRSEDGVRFEPVARRQEVVDEHAERCTSSDGERVYRLTWREDGAAQQVLFATAGGDSLATDLAPRGEAVTAVACDARSLVALGRRGDTTTLRVCGFAGRCAELTPPPLLATATPRAAADVAKVANTIVLSVTDAGVTRVVSSRDEGRHFTPAVVAFDAGEYPDLAVSRRPPSRLLALGDRLLLYAGAVKSGEPYLALWSDDQGVSFRAP